MVAFIGTDYQLLIDMLVITSHTEQVIIESIKEH